MTAYRRKDEWGDTWHYRKRVTLPDGRSQRIAGTPSINTKAAAEAAERAHVERLLNPPKPVRERHKMDYVLDRFLADYVTIANNKSSEKASKTTSIERYLRPQLGGMFADEITSGTIADLTVKLHRMPNQRHKGETLGAKTVKNILQTLRKCLRWACKTQHWIDEVPEIQMPRVDEAEIRFLEDAELDALLKATAKEPIWFAAILLAADAGLRAGEFRELKWTDVNDVTNKLSIARSRWRHEVTSPKSRKPRSVPISIRLREALQAIRSRSGMRGPYVLSKADGRPFGAEHLCETMDRLSRAAAITDCGWHTLRHTWITRLAKLGVPPRDIQKLAGHQSLATTMRYMHVVAGADDDAIAKLDAANARRPRTGHGNREGGDIDSETGDVVQLFVVTPKGLET